MWMKIVVKLVPVQILTHRQQYIICSSSCISHVAETQFLEYNATIFSL